MRQVQTVEVSTSTDLNSYESSVAMDDAGVQLEQARHADAHWRQERDSRFKIHMQRLEQRAVSIDTFLKRLPLRFGFIGGVLMFVHVVSYRIFVKGITEDLSSLAY